MTRTSNWLCCKGFLDVKTHGSFEWRYSLNPKGGMYEESELGAKPNVESVNLANLANDSHSRNPKSSNQVRLCTSEPHCWSIIRGARILASTTHEPGQVGRHFEIGIHFEIVFLPGPGGGENYQKL